jgi:Fe-S oxidoreductase
MELKIRQSVHINDIDREKIYFNPSCVLSIYKPDLAGRLIYVIKKYFPKVKLHNICCKHDPDLPKGSTVINNCAGCDRRFGSEYDGVNTISLWEILDSFQELEIPSYKGLVVSIQDPCSFRQKPQVHKAVRNILHKMGIKIIESQFNGTKSICCGDSFYNKIPLTQVCDHQKKRASQMPCQDVLVYCVSCMISIKMGGKKPHNLVDLLLSEATDPHDLEIVSFNDALGEYIKQH